MVTKIFSHDYDAARKKAQPETAQYKERVLQWLAEAIAEERERCAKVAETFDYTDGTKLDRRERLLRTMIAEEIRK